MRATRGSSAVCVRFSSIATSELKRRPACRPGSRPRKWPRSTSMVRPGANDATLERCRKRAATLHRLLFAADFPGGALEDIRDPPLLLRRCVHDRGERSAQRTACFVELVAPAAMPVVALIGA